MNVFDQIQQSGWGALFLFVYSTVILYLLPSNFDKLMFVVIASSPSLVLIFLSVVFNDWLMDLFAGDEIKKTFETIDDRTGEEEFYWDADSDVREEINKMDKQAHQYLVSILSGIVISASLPFVVYFMMDLQEVFLSLIGSVIIGYLLSYRGSQSLRQVIKSSEKLYNVDNEN